MRWRRVSLWSLLLLVIGGVGTLWALGGFLVAPRPATIGTAPPDLDADTVRIPVLGQTYVVGWWHSGKPGRASVLLLHGIRADRRDMLERARLLSRHGHAVLLIDLPAHGESPGDAITLGWRESAAVTAARDWIRKQRPREAVAAIGVSLGGASILLAPQPSGFDAVVLEAVYSDAHQAIRNRISMRLGDGVAALSPLLEIQTRLRLGVPVQALSPLRRIDRLGTPVLVIAGGRDQHTLLWESRALFERARAPKAFWLLPDAAHEDFQAAEPDEYATRVLGFLNQYAVTAGASNPAQPSK